MAFDDEDVLSYDPVAAEWELFYDGSDLHPDAWPAADLVAVPEPGMLASLAAGLAAQGGLGRWLARLGLARSRT